MRRKCCRTPATGRPASRSSRARCSRNRSGRSDVAKLPCKPISQPRSTRLRTIAAAAGDSGRYVRSPARMVASVGVPHRTNHVERTPCCRSVSSRVRIPCPTGSRPVAASAEPSVRPQRPSCPFLASSARRSSVNSGQYATTSRSWVNAAAQRLPSGHGVARTTRRRPALAITEARQVHEQLEAVALRAAQRLARWQSDHGLQYIRRGARSALILPGDANPTRSGAPMAEPLLPKDRIPWRHLVAFGWLPSSLKILAHRLFLGYRIGRGVRFSFGGVVVGDTVELGDFVEIGFLAIVQGRTIRIGRHSSVGTMSYVSCETIEIGEDAKIREQVYVGGAQLPESRFALGSRTIILQLSFINPTKPVVIGDDTGIGGHCLIFTHGAWLSALDGYPVNYEPVTLGKSVWLPWRVFVMPGTTIGDGTVIGADS